MNSSLKDEPQSERLPTFIRFDDAPLPRASPPRRSKTPNKEGAASPRRSKRDKEPDHQPAPPLPLLVSCQSCPMVLSELDWNYTFVLHSILQEDFEGALDCIRSYPSLLSDHAQAVNILVQLCRVQLPPSPSSSPPVWLVYYELVQTVLALQPRLVRQTSSNNRSRTPLHAAVANPTLSPLVLEWLVLVDQEWFTDVPHPVDENGLTLLDVILYRLALQDDNAITTSNTTTMELYNTLLRCMPPTVTRQQQRSPLLTLLSIFPSSQPSQVQWLLHCAETLLEWNPDLLTQASMTTGCTPLHVGMRNHGHNDQLLTLLACPWSWSARNVYGDLPLHVACSAGVPYDILTWTLQCTYRAATTTTTNTSNPVHPHPLVWSVNTAGYTPIDLEWMRHIEAGHGLLSCRSFLVLDARGVRPLMGRYHDLYDKLLRQCVDAVLHAPFKPLVSTTGGTTVGLLLHRIVLLVQACFGDCWEDSLSLSFPANSTLLHNATALASARGPSLPLPIVEMILWQNPEQLCQPDSKGRVPLHCAMPVTSVCSSQEGSAKSLRDWQKLVDLLVRRCPEACRVVDCSGRLPLHCALQYTGPNLGDAGDSSTLIASEGSALSRVVQLLLEAYPHSSEVLDPVTGLYPFHLAAIHPLLTLDVRFLLLRKNPRVISSGQEE